MTALVLFGRVLGVECLKLKRTLALGMVLLAPLIVVILHGLIGYAGAADFVRGGREAWPQLVSNAIGMWTILMMPLFITLETSLLAGLEHNGNWKSALALPVPRWMLYAGKLLITVAMLWAAHAVLIVGVLGVGLTLREIQPALKLESFPLRPLLRPMLTISAAALLGLAIQHWVSLRWASFAAAIGFGMFAMVTGFVAANSREWGRHWPWSLPMHALRPTTAGEIDLVVVGVVGALVVASIGALDFSRREMT